jgi:hypothetical protein
MLGIQIQDTISIGFKRSHLLVMILFSIRWYEIVYLYVVRWTKTTKKLDVKIAYNFLFVLFLRLCLSF